MSPFPSRATTTITADSLYLYVHNEPVPPQSRCWFGSAGSIWINHHQNIAFFLQTEDDSYNITFSTDKLLLRYHITRCYWPRGGSSNSTTWSHSLSKRSRVVCASHCPRLDRHLRSYCNNTLFKYFKTQASLSFVNHLYLKTWLNFRVFLRTVAPCVVRVDKIPPPQKKKTCFNRPQYKSRQYTRQHALKITLHSTLHVIQ